MELPNVKVQCVSHGRADYWNLPVPLPNVCPLAAVLALIPGFKSTAVNHHKSRAASNIPMTLWQINPSSKQPLQKQEHKRRHCPCLKAHVCWNHKHAVVPCLTKEKTHEAFSPHNKETCLTNILPVNNKRFTMWRKRYSFSFHPLHAQHSLFSPYPVKEPWNSWYCWIKGDFKWCQNIAPMTTAQIMKALKKFSFILTID